MTRPPVHFGSWSAEEIARASKRKPAALYISVYNASRLARAGRVARVPPAVARILAALFVGRILTTGDLIDLLYSDAADGGPDGADRIVSKYIALARMAGAILGIVVPLQRVRGYSAHLVELNVEDATPCG